MQLPTSAAPGAIAKPTSSSRTGSAAARLRVARRVRTRAARLPLASRRQCLRAAHPKCTGFKNPFKAISRSQPSKAEPLQGRAKVDGQTLSRPDSVHPGKEIKTSHRGSKRKLTSRRTSSARAPARRSRSRGRQVLGEARKWASRTAAKAKALQRGRPRRATDSEAPHHSVRSVKQREKRARPTRRRRVEEAPSDDLRLRTL